MTAVPPSGWLIANLISQLAFGLLAMTISLPSMQDWPATFAAGQGSGGLGTLATPLGQHDRRARTIAQWLATRPEVAQVLHPALPDCPGHDSWARDFHGATGLFSIVMDGGDRKAAAALIDGLQLFGIGFSWGGFESLALPVNPQPLRTAVAWSAPGPVIRLHIGLEDPADLIADLEQGLARFRAAR